MMIERVSGMSLESYIQQNIEATLGIESLVFDIQSYPHIYGRIVGVSLRKERSGPVEWTSNTIWPRDMKEHSGGSGAFASIADYQKILHSITANDGQLLESSSVDQLFLPEMAPAVRASVKNALIDENINNIFGGMPKGADITCAMGGMVVLEDLPGRRMKGSMYWGGLLNVFFWMDRKAGLTGIFGSQVFPAGDSICLGLFAEFERETYKAIERRTEV